MKPDLHIVADNEPAPRNETVSQRVRRLQAEAKQAAKDQVRLLQAHLLQAQLAAADVADVGPIMPPGIRELASRLADQLDAHVHTLEAIAARTL